MLFLSFPFLLLSCPCITIYFHAFPFLFFLSIPFHSPLFHIMFFHFPSCCSSPFFIFPLLCQTKGEERKQTERRRRERKRFARHAGQNELAPSLAQGGPSSHLRCGARGLKANRMMKQFRADFTYLYIIFRARDGQATTVNLLCGTRSKFAGGRWYVLFRGKLTPLPVDLGAPRAAWPRLS